MSKNYWYCVRVEIRASNREKDPPCLFFQRDYTNLQDAAQWLCDSTVNSRLGAALPARHHIATVGLTRVTECEIDGIIEKEIETARHDL